MKKIRFYLLGYKGLKVLKSLDKEELKIISDIVVAKDKSVINDYSHEIEEFCKLNQLNYFRRGAEPNSKDEFQIAIGWRWLINDNNGKLIVIHDSLLPRLRGFNPLVTALINGDDRIGATALLANEEFDKGLILYQKAVQIQYPIKIKEAIELVSNLYSNLLKIIIRNIDANTIKFKKQNEKFATYSLWRDEEDYIIDWNWDTEKIKRFIDAVGFPYKGAKTNVLGNEVRIFDAKIIDDVVIENRVPGKVLFKDINGLTIACGKGLIKIKDFYLNDNSLLDYTRKFRLRFQ